jgi:hypothetical protein
MVSRLVEVSNRAVTARAAFIVTVQVAPVPPQAPDHPRNREPELGAAVSVTTASLGKLGLQDAVQLPPAQLTVPLPGPAKVNARGYVEGSNETATCRSAVIVKVHGPVPVHVLAQPWKREVASGAAASVTDSP